MRALARREGSRRAQTILCLADGARAIWALFDTLFPDAVQLLDRFHLMEHVGAVAAVLPDGAAWLATQQTAVWERGPREVLHALVAVCRDAGLPDATRTLARQCLGYVWHNRHRMDYATAHRRGWPCGSGRIESAIKQVAQARLKGPGMRWDHAHAQQMLNLRCAWLSGDLDLACAQARTAAHQPVRAIPSGPIRQPRLAHQGREPLRVPTRHVATPRPPDLSTKEAADIVRQAVFSL